MLSRNVIIFIFFSLIFNHPLQAQRLIDREGTIRFFSEAPLENIEAVSEQALGAIDLASGNVAVSIPIRSFNFKKSLMQEHFNENYMESDKFPKASFSGSLVSFSYDELQKSSGGNYVLAGTITIHGITQPFEGKVEMAIKDRQLNTKTTFNISVADHGVAIPTLLIKNIAEVVEVTAIFQFELQNP